MNFENNAQKFEMFFRHFQPHSLELAIKHFMYKPIALICQLSGVFKEVRIIFPDNSETTITMINRRKLNRNKRKIVGWIIGAIIIFSLLYMLGTILFSF